jgi:hypothetical protein
MNNYVRYIFPRGSSLSRVGIATALIAGIVPEITALGQSVSGHITESTTGAAVSGASLVLLDKGGHPKSVTNSGPEGNYSITAAENGTYTLSVSGPGLNPIQTQPVQLLAGKPTNLDIALSLGAPKLATVVVKGAKSVVHASSANPGKYNEFLRRRELGIGTFLTREQIEMKPSAQTFELFTSIPGLKVRQNGTQWYVQSAHCRSLLPAGSRNTMDDDDPTTPERYPILFIDGVRVRGLGYLREINPSQIEGIEIYQGASELPPIAKGNACAAIFVWLKSGQ